MGSFNVSCFVSKQTIASDHEAVILPIIQQATYNPISLLAPSGKDYKEFSKYGFRHSNCYPTSLWGYAGPIIKGTYDDYGQFNLAETTENTSNLISFFNSLSKNICNVKQGENETHEPAFDFSELYSVKEKYTFVQLTEIWEQVWDISQRSRLFLNDHRDDPRCVAFAVMHKCSADYLLETVNNSKNWDNVSMEQHAYFNHYVNERISRMLEIFQDKKEKNDIIRFAAIGLIGLEGYRIGEQEGTYLGKYYKDADDAIDKIVSYFEKNPESVTIPQNITDEVFDEFKSQIEHRYIAHALTNLNIKLSPLEYGSQDDNNELGNDYLTMLKEVNERVNKTTRARFGYDEEEEEEAEQTTSKKPKM